MEPHPLLKQLLAHYSSGPASRHLIAPVIEAERESSPGQPSEFIVPNDQNQCPVCQEEAKTNENQSSNDNHTDNQNQQGK